MSTSTRKRGNVIGFLGIIALSSTLMLWMFWHFPLATLIATFIALMALGLSARLARWVDTDRDTAAHGKLEIRGGRSNSFPRRARRNARG